VPFFRARRAILFAVGACLLIVALTAANLALFVWPSSGTLRHADAVVVLAGGDGERLDRGLELVREGLATTLVVSTGPPQLCETTQLFDVVCFHPSPDSTRGEAEAIGRIASERGWNRIVLVTSTYHMSRARLLLDRCYTGTVEIATAQPDQGLGAWIAAIAHEWGGLAEAVVHRSC
jgi:uncharacterized SAM-binding protein YcdF (DUF218 family)